MAAPVEQEGVGVGFLSSSGHDGFKDHAAARWLTGYGGNPREKLRACSNALAFGALIFVPERQLLVRSKPDKVDLEAG